MKKVVSLVLLLCVMLSLCACGAGQSNANEEANYALYIKDSELNFANFKKEPLQVTSTLFRNMELYESSLSSYGNVLSYFTCVSEDEKLVFFPDKLDGEAEFNLYYCKTSDAKSDATKIDAGVVNYAVSSDSNTVTYTKGSDEDSVLYTYSVKDDSKTKIASEVKEFYVTDDAKSIIYVNTDSNLYIYRDGKETEKLVGDITEIVHISEDFSVLYYTKDEALYRHIVGEKKEKIDSGEIKNINVFDSLIYYFKDDALYKYVQGETSERIDSDVSNIIEIYDSGEVYYVKDKYDKVLTLMDYVEDDMKEQDSKISSIAPSYPYFWNYNTTEEYEAAYEEYEIAYKAYKAKKAREALRESLAEEEVCEVLSLYFYDGSEKNCISDNYVNELYQINAEEVPVLAYYEYDANKATKLKMSEIFESTLDDLDSENPSVYGFAEYIAVGTSTTPLEQTNALVIDINKSGTMLYYADIDLDANNDVMDLYCIQITDGVFGEETLCDTDVYSDAYGFVSDNDFAYFMDVKNETGDLYIML